MLLLDIGDAIQGAGDYAKIKADFYCKALPLLKYDAVALGEMEVRHVQEHPDAELYGDIPLINANVFHSSGKPFVPKPYVVKKTASGLKVGIISILTGQTVIMAIPPQSGVTVSPPEEILRKRVEELRKKANIVILLSHAGGTSRALAGSIPGIDVVLSGHSMGLLAEAPEKAGDVIYMSTRQNGKYLGKLVLDIGADKKISGFTGEYVGLDKSIPKDPEIEIIVGNHDRAVETYQAEMRLALAASTGAHRDPRPFVGASKCAECHAEEHASWTKTGHAKASEALTKDNRQNDPECVSCHSTGFKAKGGFVSARTTPLLAAVQCESCHGPGVIHSRRPQKGYGAVLRSTCFECHNAVRSPKFEYKSYLSKITHGKQESPQP